MKSIIETNSNMILEKPNIYPGELTGGHGTNLAGKCVTVYV
jgi:hypothetical protein